MSNKKTVYFKNPERNVKENKEIFVPAHKRAGINPAQYVKQQTFNVPSNNPNFQKKQVVSNNNPDTVVNELYGTLTNATGLPKEAFINPHQETISTVDGMDVNLDDVEVPDNIMHPPLNQNNTESNEVNDDDIVEILSSLDEGSYLLLVDGAPICSGPLDQIEDEVSALIYGKHELCDGELTDPQSVCVLKKMSIKVGAFLE